MAIPLGIQPRQILPHRSLTLKLIEIILLMAPRLPCSIWVPRIVVGRLAIHAAQISNSVGDESWEPAPIALNMMPSLSNALDARNLNVSAERGRRCSA
jgi:hypothetical protein